jgi:uncharacterized protein
MNIKKPFPMNKYSYTLFLVLISFNLYISANDIPERPSPPKLVNDFANILRSEEILNLEKKLVDFNRQTSTQIAVVIVNDLHGYDRADFTVRLAEKWGVGQKGKDNGMVIMVKPKTSSSGGQAFIATGYGLESVVPDATAKRIVENEMIPEFKTNNYYAGLNKATDVLISLTKGEFTAEDYNEQTGKDTAPSVIAIIFFIIFFLAFFARARTRRHHSIGHSIPFWIALSMLGSSGRSSGGSFGNFSSGGGSFGGFGGGSFGGGGAGGSW